MKGVLLDTSTLIDLVLHFNRPAKDPPFYRAVSEAIEALIIYENIYVDGPSFQGFTEGS